jgi:hypothetical protein
MADFFEETETPAERDARDIAGEIKALSDEARQEIRDFVLFKKQQQTQVTDDTTDSEEKP